MPQKRVTHASDDDDDLDDDIIKQTMLAHLLLQQLLDWKSWKHASTLKWTQFIVYVEVYDSSTGWKKKENSQQKIKINININKNSRDKIRIYVGNKIVFL